MRRFIVGFFCLVLAGTSCRRTTDIGEGVATTAPQATAQITHVLAGNGTEPTRDSAKPQPTPRNAPIDLDAGTLPEERTIYFEFRPKRARASEYEMADPRDRHRVVIFGDRQGGPRKTVIAFHGQPRRGKAPRDYAFPETVTRLARTLVRSGEIEPFTLVMPVFRLEGQNWPGFLLDEFLPELNRALRPHGVNVERPFLVGHSGALGCGGGGLNQPLRITPSGVGTFDTCIGANFVSTLRKLGEHHVPTLVLQSVETAGQVPRHVPEYDTTFDFGPVFRKAGLAPRPCPTKLPGAPLRDQPYRCAIDPTGSVQAFIIDTGTGDPAHEAALEVGAAFFLRTFLGRSHTGPG